MDAIPLICSWSILSVIIALVAFVLYMTFVPGLPTEPGFTLRHWSNVFSSRLLTRVIPNTVIVGFGTIFIGAFFALPLASLLNRTTLPFRTIFTTIIGIVPVIPGFILAMGWIMLLDERIGLINNVAASARPSSIALSVKDSPWGIAWVLGSILTPADLLFGRRSFEPHRPLSRRGGEALPHETSHDPSARDFALGIAWKFSAGSYTRF